MKTYDPLKPPKADEWRSMDEQERLDLVQMEHLLTAPDAEIGTDQNRSYYAALEQLTAKDWLALG